MKWLQSRTLAQGTLLASLLAFSACTKSGRGTSTPEGALNEYVHAAFGAKSMDDAKTLLDLSTGDAKEWLSSMSQEAFKKQFIDNKMVLQSLTTKDVRQEKNGDVSLVYELAFKDGSPDGKPTSPAVYTNKKIAYLTKEGDAWKIKATKNVKSFVERKDALEILTPETTDKNPAAPEKK
ncbi:MAG: hypothetical protein ACXVB9_16970 [Bdellovibrionota bacterium]